MPWKMVRRHSPDVQNSMALAVGGVEELWAELEVDGFAVVLERRSRIGADIIQHGEPRTVFGASPSSQNNNEFCLTLAEGYTAPTNY
jgi:hypothetical protein